MDKFARKFLAASGDPRKVIADVHWRYFGTELNDRSLTPGHHPRIGTTRFDVCSAGQRRGARRRPPLRTKNQGDDRSLQRYASWQRYWRSANKRIYDAVAGLPARRGPRRTGRHPSSGSSGRSTTATPWISSGRRILKNKGTASRHATWCCRAESCPSATSAAGDQPMLVNRGDGQTAPWLEGSVSFRFIDGASGAMTRGDILLHVVNHATYHQGWITQMLLSGAGPQL